MKKTTALKSLGALLAAGTALTSMAQTSVTQTNVTLDLDFYLTTVSQGTVTTTNHGVIVNAVDFGRITEGSIISELGASTSNTFSPRAELLLVIPTNTPDDWTVEVHDGTNRVDVTGFFTYVPGTDSVGSTTASTTTGVMGDTEYSIDRFGLHDQTNFPALSTHFHVSGFTITTVRGIVTPTATASPGEIESINSTVDGTGEKDGNLIIIEGLITARGNDLSPTPVPVTSGLGF